MKRPLNELEKLYAEQNLDIVERYLSRRHLSRDTFYDIVIFGYLRAVQKYLASEDLQQYKFTTIANSAMNTEVSNYYRALNRKKRRATVLDIDTALFAGGLPISEILGDIQSCDYQKQLEDRELLKYLLADATDQELELLTLKADGYSYREIGLICDMGKHTVYKKISGLRKRVIPLYSGI